MQKRAPTHDRYHSFRLFAHVHDSRYICFAHPGSIETHATMDAQKKIHLRVRFFQPTNNTRVFQPERLEFQNKDGILELHKCSMAL